MGASDFHNSVEVSDRLPTAADAFQEMQDNAAWECGHGGYTGTIAEKPGFVKFEMVKGASVYDLRDALEQVDCYASDEDHTAAKAKLESLLANGKHDMPAIRELYADKWSPAICVRNNGEWHFFGYASS